MKLPFIGYKKQERAFRKFLREFTGRDARDIRQQEVEDNEYLVRDLTYTGVQEIFDAGWDAAENAIKRLREVRK